MRFGCRLLFACGLWSMLGCGNPAASPPIVLGHVADLSGPGRKIGAKESAGIRLALEDLHKQAGERPIQVRHADTQGKLEAYEAQAVRLLAINRVAALLGGETLEEVLRLDRARPSTFSGEPATLAIVSPLGSRSATLSDQTFLLGMNSVDQGKALAQFAAESLKAKRLRIVVLPASAGAKIAADACGRAFAERVKEKDSVVHVDTIEVPPDDKSADAVVVAGTVDDLKALGDVRVPILYVGDDGSLTPDADVTGTVYFASAFAVDRSIAEIDEFARRYREVQKDEPDVHAALAYESTYLLGSALRRVTTPETLRPEMLKEFTGLAGKLHFDERQQLHRPLFLLRQKGNKVESLQRVVP